MLACIDSVLCCGSAHHLEIDHIWVHCDHIDITTISDKRGEEDKVRKGKGCLILIFTRCNVRAFLLVVFEES